MNEIIHKDILNAWHQAVLIAYIRRELSTLRKNECGRVVVAQSKDYHPAKAARIYRRFASIIDLYL